MSAHSIADSLRGLESTALDAAEGYTRAARCCDDPDTRERLAQFAIQRREHAEQLRLLLDHPAEEYVERSQLARAHRAIIELRGRWSHGAAAPLVAECLRGEHVALAQYESALRLPLVTNVRDVLTMHVAAVRHALSSA